jgi:hypothetical protein
MHSSEILQIFVSIVALGSAIAAVGYLLRRKPMKLQLNRNKFNISKTRSKSVKRKMSNFFYFSENATIKRMFQRSGRLNKWYIGKDVNVHISKMKDDNNKEIITFCLCKIF